MNTTAIHQPIIKLKSQIESHLQWGESSVWNNYDFEKLSEQITEKTSVSLSVSTLKRIFGKVSYKSEPSMTTLNALAQFLDYEDWRDFLVKNTENTEVLPPRIIPTPPVPSPSLTPLTTGFWNRQRWALVTLAVVSLSIFGFYFLSSKPKYNPNDFNFSSKTILTQGLPNSVIFDFDASNANPQDSVFISQSWDVRRKVLVNKNDKHHSSIYYYPGYFRAKLMIGKEIIKEHDIQIKTDGWLGVVEADWGIEPLYFKQSDIVNKTFVEVNRELLQKYDVSLHPTPPKIRLFNQKDIKGIMTDNFTFETELKSGPDEGNNACQKVTVLLQAKNDIMIIPLTKVGCVGDISLAAFGYYVASDKADLSGFGCTPSDWTKLRIECKQGEMKLFVNNKLAYTAKVTNTPTDIIGVQYRFNGTGAVRNTWLEGKDEKIVF
ncbi:hypothetical protein P1X15_16660 [Runella sp. MFBS21]|uniref:hypothetical protein n=1 Tax=Runella sp. MFBS21 TaxID=3034018 RepID=UPI0023F64850|nr:hypothetical protein [Runella sp. MFBS21]MDF7819253.1 hypothetical protein [Runella sp. MFBS21]